MTRRNRQPPTGLPNDDGQSSRAATFNNIVSVVRQRWIRMCPHQATHRIFGHLHPWGKRSVMFIFSSDPDSKRMRLHGTVADQVKRDTLKFRGLLTRSSANYPRAEAIFDQDCLTVQVQADGVYHSHLPSLKREIDFMYQDLIGLIHDEFLYTAVVLVEARFLGTPLDVWDYA